MKTRSVWTLAAALVATLVVGFVGVEPAAAAPAISSIAPTALGQGATSVDLVVNGSGFDGSLGGPNVAISGTGITVNGTVMNSSTKLTANLTVASNATVSQRTVTVSQGPGGIQTTTCPNCLTIAAGPTIAGTPSPSGAPNTGGPPALVTVTGTNFATSGAELRLQRPEFTDIVATGVAVNGAGTSISGSFNLTGQAAAYWKVVVINPNKGRTEFGNLTSTGFLVSGATPTLTDVAPSTRSSGTTGTVLTLTGTNFARGATVTFSPNAGGTDIVVSSPTWVSLTSFQVTVSIASEAATGPRNVTFTNFDTQPATCNACFTVTGPPSVTSIDPTSRGQGAQNQIIAVTGTDFVDTPTVTVSGAGVTVDSVLFDDAEHLQVQIDVAPGAAITVRTMTVTNPDGGFDTTAFTVNAAPTVSSATPASRGQNATNQDIVITGTNFVSGVGLAVSFSGTGVTEVSPPTFTDAQHITAHVNVSSTAATTARDVTVTNPDQGVGTGTGKLTVTAGPTVSTLAPNALARGVSHHTVVVNGANFQSTPTIKFFNGSEDTNIVVHSVTRDSSTHLTLDVSVNNADTTGTRDVLVTNPDAGNSLATDVFTVDDPPTIDAIVPTSSGQGATISGATISGGNFQSTPTITFSGTGVTASNVVRDSAVHLTFTLVIDTNAATTARDVTVTNPDFGTATLAGGFTVTSGPHVTAITPNNGANSGTTTITNLAGSGFAANAQVTLERNGFAAVPMQGETVNGGGTQIQGTFPLATGGPGGAPVAPGVWSVKVVNPTDNGTGTLTNGFTVTSAAPTVTGAYTQQQGTAKLQHLTGTNFADGAVVTVSGTGVTAGSSTVIDSTHLDVTLTATSGATLGAHDITVTNTDNQAGTCTGCLTVRTNPVIASLNPNARGQGTSHKSVAVNGSGFDATPTVSFSGSGITVHSVTRNSAVLLTLDISIDAAAATGARNVTVTNSDGGTNTTNGAFTVTPAPQITNLNPNSRGQGAAHQAVVVNGSAFDTAPTVTFSGSGVTVHSVTRDSAVQLTLDLSIDPNALTGARDVTVTNADGGTVTSPGAFTINVRPTTSSANPNSMVQGATGNVVLTGSNYVTTPTVSFSGTGITVNTVTRNSAAMLTVNVTIGGSAATGARDVTVTNPDQGTSTTPGLFSVAGGNAALAFQGLGNPILGSPALLSTAADSASVVYTSSANGSIQARVLTGGTWGPPLNLGGVGLDGPGASSRGSVSDVFIQGGDHAVWFDECGNPCTGWSSLGGQMVGTPASVSWDSTRIDVFVRGTDNRIYQRSSNNGTWTPNWVSLGGIVTSSPTVTSTAVNRLTLAARGTDGAVWVQTWNGSAWTGWVSAGGQIKTAPALVAQSGSRIDLFVRGTNDGLFRSRNFGGFSSLGGILSASPAATLVATGGGGVIEIAVRGSDGLLYVAQRAFP